MRKTSCRLLSVVCLSFLLCCGLVSAQSESCSTCTASVVPATLPTCVPTCANPQPAPACNGTLTNTVGADLCPVWSCNCPSAPTCEINQYLSAVAGNPCTEYACISCPVVIRPKCYTNAGNYYAPKCTGYNACGQCASWWCYPRGAEYGNGCFPPGVKITLADGSTKAVEEIKVGDLVLSPKTGAGLKVVNLIEGSEELPIIRIKSGDLQLRVTTEHIIVTSEGLKRARDLLITDLISDSKGSFRAIDSLENLAVEIGQKVINFQLSGEDPDVNKHLLISDGVVTGDLYLQNNFDKKKS